MKTAKPWPTTMQLEEYVTGSFMYAVYRGDICVRSGGGYTTEKDAEVGGLTFIRKTYGDKIAEKVWLDLRNEEADVDDLDVLLAAADKEEDVLF